MLNSTLGDYPLYIIEPDEEYEAEPFSYAVRISLEGDEDAEQTYKFAAMCNDIPCSYCSVQESCENGKNRVKALTENFKDFHPEYFI